MKKLETILGVELSGMFYGLVGILGFSITLPATRVAVRTLDPVFVGFGRALVAAILAAIILIATRQKLPNRDQLKSLCLVALGVIVGFPLLSAWALKSVPASHGAIIVGMIPLATIVAGIFRVKENPSLKFWLISITGTLVIIAYAFLSHSGSMQWEDMALLGAVISSGIGYAEGAKLTAVMGGWRVISWALVIAAPFLILPVIYSVDRNSPVIPLEAWIGFGYVSVVSQFTAFFVWYKGLAMGGIARVGQVQLLQPFFTIVASAFLLHEQITPLAITAMFAVALVVALGRTSAVKKMSSAKA